MNKVADPDIKISEELQALAMALDTLFEEIAGQKMHFSLVVFNSEPGSRMNYISNCDRHYVVSAMKSLLRSWEEGMPDIKAHELN